MDLHLFGLLHQTRYQTHPTSTGGKREDLSSHLLPLIISLGPSLFISPILHGSKSNDKGLAIASIEFPEDSSTMWLDFWEPLKEPHSGGTKENIPYPLSLYPVFIRKGSYIPMANASDPTIPVFTLYQHCMEYDDMPTVTTQFRERNGLGMVSTITKTS